MSSQLEILDHKLDLNLPPPSSCGSSYSDTNSTISETWIYVRTLGEIPRANRHTTGIIQIFQCDIFDNEEDFILQTFFKSIEQSNNK